MIVSNFLHDCKVRQFFLIYDTYLREKKVSTIDIRTVTGAVDALKVIDRALDRIHMERAKFGAIMSRMNVVIDNLTNVTQNQRASRARIVDADFALESAKLSKSQILQQSAMNMVAQASRTMQNVLVLFQ